MPKTKTTRGKKYRPRYVYRHPIETKWQSRFLGELDALEGRLLLHLHKGEADFGDVLNLRDLAMAAQFIIAHRQSQFKGEDLRPWVEEFYRVARQLNEVAKRSLDRNLRIVCTGEELRAINSAMGPVLEFIRDNLKSAPRMTTLEIYACALLRREGGAKAGRDADIHADLTVIERYYQRAGDDLLTGRMWRSLYPSP